MTSLLEHLSSARRRVLRHRRGLAAACAALAAYAAVRGATATPPPLQPTWTAARDLPAGVVLSAVDLQRVGYAPGSRPDGAIAGPAAVLGRALAGPVRRGQPLTDRAVVAKPVWSGYPGLASVPVRILDSGVVALLRVGDRVCLVAADPQGRLPATVVAPAVPVVALPQSPGRGLSGRLVVIAVQRADLAPVVSAATSGQLTVAWNC